MATLQVRSIDDQLYELLGKKAKTDNRSISQEVITILKEHLSQPTNNRNKNATEKFLELAGSWEDSRTESEIVNDILQSRKNTDRMKEGL